MLNFTMRRVAGRWLTLTALLLLLTAFAISVAINVAINTAQQGWSVAAPPSDRSSVPDGWQLAHLRGRRGRRKALGCAVLPGHPAGQPLTDPQHPLQVVNGRPPAFRA